MKVGDKVKGPRHDYTMTILGIEDNIVKVEHNDDTGKPRESTYLISDLKEA